MQTWTQTACCFLTVLALIPHEITAETRKLPSAINLFSDDPQRSDRPGQLARLNPPSQSLSRRFHRELLCEALVTQRTPVRLNLGGTFQPTCIFTRSEVITPPQALRKQFPQTTSSTQVYTGRIEGDPRGVVAISICDGFVTGCVNTHGSQVTWSTVGPGNRVEVTGSLTEPTSQASSIGDAPADELTSMAVGTESLIYQVLVFYTPDMLALAGSQQAMESYLQTEIALVNIALDYACRELYPAPGSIEKVLKINASMFPLPLEKTWTSTCDFTTQNDCDIDYSASDYAQYAADLTDGRFDEIGYWQELLLADAVVVLKVPRQDGLRGQTVHNLISISGPPPIPYVAVNGTKAYVLDLHILGHELGHTFGIGHDNVPPEPTPGWSDYARGWTWFKDGIKYGCLMAQDQDATPIQRLVEFSDPRFIFGYDDLGNPIYRGDPLVADAARHLREVRQTLMNYRPPFSSLDTTLRITSPTQVTATVGQLFSYQLTTTLSPSQPAEWYGVLQSLPSGLSLDEVSGLISGTPESSGQWSLNLGARRGGDIGQSILQLTITDQGGCAATAALKANRIFKLLDPTRLLSTDDQILKTLRSFRDQVLAKHASGRRLIDVYYQHGRELSQLVTEDPQRVVLILETLAAALPAIEATAAASPRMSLDSATFARCEQILESIQKAASPELAQAMTEAMSGVTSTTDNDGHVTLRFD